MFAFDSVACISHITHILVLEFAGFISCETALCLRDLSVTNNYFEHACYALPQYTLP